MRIKLVVLSFLAVGLLSSKCSKDEPSEEQSFDQFALLTNYADNIIEPGYGVLYGDLIELKTAFETFEVSTSASNLSLVQDAWIKAYKSFQKVQMFNFGPAMSRGLKSALATYPTDTTKINQNVLSGTAILGAADNVDAIGFPALDYLLFDLSDETALNKFTNSVNRLTYALNVIEKMESEVLNVIGDWNAYKSEFTSNGGTSSTSSLSFLVNEFNKDFELTKNAKIGIPAGVKSLGIIRPEFIEAPFSKQSLALAYESVIGLREAYVGAAGQGFDDWLKIYDNGVELNSRILNAFEEIRSAADLIQTREFKDVLNTDLQLAVDFYEKMQANVVNIKTDMPALFGILITYQDNDGD